jgi:hypothetical protein
MGALVSLILGAFTGGGLVQSLLSIILAVIQGIFGIITTLCNSFEGRLFLAVCLLAGGFFWQRHYYIGLGRDTEAAFRTQLVQTEVNKAKAACPAAGRRR